MYASELRPVTLEYGTIIVVGGGCYGSYYVRQLSRAAHARVVAWGRLVVVDRDAQCMVARDDILRGTPGLELIVSAWEEFFADYLADASRDPEAAELDAIVPSPLMPHLLFDWIAARMAARWPNRVHTGPIGNPLSVPWQRTSESGDTHYVSFADWMCPINCIEPAKCPHTRDVRSWTMPVAVAEHVARERARGHDIDGPYVFQCVHRAYGVGMIDVREVLDAERRLATAALGGARRFLVGTVSHCHGALGVLELDR
jgi:hypothetical protein